jgi:MFS family permease
MRMVTESMPPEGRPRGHDGDIPTADERFNARLFNAEAPFTSIAISLQNFFALFAIELGASNALVGWLTSGPALVSLVWLIPCGRIVQRARTTAGPFATGALFHRMLLIAMGVIPLLPPEWRAWALVLLVTAQSVPGTLRAIAFQTASGEMFSARYFTHFIGQRWAIMSVADVVGMLLLGWMVEAIPFPLSLQVLCGGIGLLALVSIWFVLRLRLPQHAQGRPLRTDTSRASVRLGRAWQQHKAFV